MCKGWLGVKDLFCDGLLVFVIFIIFVFVGILGVGFRVYLENVNMYIGVEDFEVMEFVFVLLRFYEFV